MADSKNTKEGRLVALKYADILHLSRPETPCLFLTAHSGKVSILRSRN